MASNLNSQGNVLSSGSGMNPQAKGSSDKFEEENSIDENELLQNKGGITIVRDEHKNLVIRIRNDIDGLEGQIKKITERHHNDYLMTFNEFMNTLKNDVREKIERMDKVEKEKRKNENINNYIAERDYFRQESIRLNETNRQQNSDILKLKHKIKALELEISDVISRLEASEKVNKQLVQELENQLRINQSLSILQDEQNKMKSSQINGFKRDEESNIGTDDFYDQFYNMMNKHKNYSVDELKTMFMKIFESAMGEIKKERIKSKRLTNELNSMFIDRNKLEKIFVNCIEEARKDIYFRREKDKWNFVNTSLNGQAIAKMQKIQPIPSLSDIKFENFLHTDKQKLAQAFITNDEVIMLIQNSMFLNKAMDSLKSSHMSATSKNHEFSGTRSTLTKTLNLSKPSPNPTSKRRDKSSKTLKKTGSFSIFV